MTRKYKAILFDYDGTIIDTNQMIIDSWDHMYHKHFGGHLTGDEVRWTFGMVLWDAIEEQLKKMGHFEYDIDELVASYREYQKDPCPTPAPPFEGMIELIKELKNRGYLLGIVTSRNSRSTMAGLEKYGIADCFDAFVTADNTDVHKPLPDPAILCCQKLGVEPSEAVMVGDSVFDLMCGNSAGCDSCFVSWSFATDLDKALGEGHPTFVIDKPEELLERV